MYEKFYSLREIMMDHKLFFKNKQGPELYNVWRNYLIVTDLKDKTAKVWKVYDENGMTFLRPVAKYASNKDGIRAAKFYHEPTLYKMPEPIFTYYYHDLILEQHKN